jgi:hypothetical protein
MWSTRPSSLRISYRWSSPSHCANWLSGGSLSPGPSAHPPRHCEALFPRLPYQIPGRAHLHGLHGGHGSLTCPRLPWAILLARRREKINDRCLLKCDVGWFVVPSLFGRICLSFSSRHVRPGLTCVKRVSREGEFSCAGTLLSAYPKARASLTGVPALYRDSCYDSPPLLLLVADFRAHGQPGLREVDCHRPILSSSCGAY